MSGDFGHVTFVVSMTNSLFRPQNDLVRFRKKQQQNIMDWDKMCLVVLCK